VTFLELCQRLRREGGQAGAGPTTVLNQTYELLDTVNWIKTAYEDIQNLHAEWNFLRADLTFQTVASDNTYPIADISATEYGEWQQDSFRSYRTSTGVAGEMFMQWLDWPDFRDKYVIGSNRTIEGNPRYIAQKPDTSLIVFPTPDAAYTINGEYFKRAQAMTVDSSEPLIPTKFHMIIVWRALMYYAGHISAPDLYEVGQREYKNILFKLESSQLPRIRLAGPLV
jgi:hypothetical protein